MSIRMAALFLAASAVVAGEINDIEFACPGGVPLTLDASIPEGKGPFAAVIVVHGGGWENGSKRSYEKPLLPVLAGAGFAWFTINYRLAPQHQYPAAVEDVEAATKRSRNSSIRLRCTKIRCTPMQLWPDW